MNIQTTLLTRYKDNKLTLVDIDAIQTMLESFEDGNIHTLIYEAVALEIHFSKTKIGLGNSTYVKIYHYGEKIYSMGYSKTNVGEIARYIRSEVKKAKIRISTNPWIENKNTKPVEVLVF